MAMRFGLCRCYHLYSLPPLSTTGFQYAAAHPMAFTLNWMVLPFSTKAIFLVFSTVSMKMQFETAGFTTVWHQHTCTHRPAENLFSQQRMDPSTSSKLLQD